MKIIRPSSSLIRINGEIKNGLKWANVKINQKEDTTENRNKHPYNNPNFRPSLANANQTMQMVRSDVNSPWIWGLELIMVMWANCATASNICAELWDTYLNKYKYGFFFLDIYLGRQDTATRIYCRFYLVQRVSLQAVPKFRSRSSG